METMVLCSTAKGISGSLSFQQKHVSDKHVNCGKINRHPFCLKQTKGFSSGLRFRVDLPLLRSTTSDEAWTGTTQTTSFVKDEEPETAAIQEAPNANDESKPSVETETSTDSKDEPESEATGQPESSLKEESETKPEPEPEPEPEPVATSETTSKLSEEAEPKPDTEPEPEPESSLSEPKPEPVTALIAEVSSTEVPQDGFTSDESFDLFKILEDAGIKFDSEDKYSVYVLGASGVTALWLAATVLRAVDSIPVLPKVLELVGIGYTVWFSYRNLIFEEKRKELFGKIDQIKQEVIGSASEED